MKKNKTSEVLNYLKEYGNISSIEAIELFGATRLSAIIFNLRKRGYNIRTMPEKFIDRYGTSGTYARYCLITKTGGVLYGKKNSE